MNRMLYIYHVALIKATYTLDLLLSGVNILQSCIFYGNVQQKTCWGLRGGRGGGEDGERGWETGADDLRHIEIWLKK